MSTDKLVLTVSHNAARDLATVAFTIANAALSRGMEVGIFLTGDGVDLAREGHSDLTHVRPFRQLDELIGGFLAEGGVVWACSPCFQNHGLDAALNYEGVVVIGAGPMLDWIAAGAATISL